MGSFRTLPEWEVLDPAQNGQTWDPAQNGQIWDPAQMGGCFEAGSPHPPTNPEFGTKLGVRLAGNGQL